MIAGGGPDVPRPHRRNETDLLHQTRRGALGDAAPSPRQNDRDHRRIHASSAPRSSRPRAPARARARRYDRRRARRFVLSTHTGRENGWDAIREYTAPKTLVVRITDEPEDWFAGGKRYG